MKGVKCSFGILEGLLVRTRRVRSGDFRFQECTHRPWDRDNIASLVTKLLSELSGFFISSETSGPALGLA